jgi:hypothetical protein
MSGDEWWASPLAFKTSLALAAGIASALFIIYES